MDDVIITSVHKESDSESQVSDNDEVMTTGAPELDEDSDVDMDEGMMEALAYGAGEVILRILNGKNSHRMKFLRMKTVYDLVMAFYLDHLHEYTVTLDW